MNTPDINIVKKDEEINGEAPNGDTEILHVDLSSGPLNILNQVVQMQHDDSEPCKQLSDNISISIKNEADSGGTVLTADSSDKTLKGMVFMVPPLLAVRQFAHHERIPISIDEIRRRIGPPESLSQALILGLLRLNKERAKQLRKALGQFGIRELPGRPAVVSSFTKLSEAESGSIAEDYFYLASRFMNLGTMNNALVQANGGAEVFEDKANATKRVLEQVLSEIEKRNMNMNLLTHGFSSYILRAVFQILIELLTHKKGQVPDIEMTP